MFSTAQSTDIGTENLWFFYCDKEFAKKELRMVTCLIVDGMKNVQQQMSLKIDDNFFPRLPSVYDICRKLCFDDFLPVRIRVRNFPSSIKTQT